MTLRPNEERAKAAEIMIWVVLGCAIIGIISNVFEYRLLKTMESGGHFTIEQADANDTRQQIIGIIMIMALVISGITYIRWFRRAYYNLHENTEWLSFSEGWAAGAWFVPILNLFRPYQIMREMYEQTAELLQKRGIEPNPKQVYVGIWWTLWVVMCILGRINLKYRLQAEEMDEFYTANILDSVDTFVYIPLSIFAVIVIRNYSKMEKMLENLNDETTTENENVEPIPIIE